jgi:hypothetical protein
MIAGKKYVGPMADIWSMGVILFALVCGYLPFEDPNTAMLYKKILSGDYKPPKWISPEAKDLIRCILEVDPRKRYTMADIRKHPWYNLVPETAIPKEITNESEDEILRAETLKLLSTNGMDMQALLDGLASHACNALTATYYLFEQRARTSRMKNPQLHSSSQPPHHHHSHETNICSKDQQKENSNNNNNNNNNNHSENNEAHRPKSNPHPETNALPLHGSIKNNNENQIVKPSPLHGANVIPANPPAEHGSSHKNNGHVPVILPSTTAAMNHNHQHNNNNNTNTNNNNTIAPISPRSPVSNKNNITPYLQTPQILQQARQIEKQQQQQQQQSHHHQQQQQQQQQSQNANGASPTSTQENADMPSLDYYMKTGLTLTIGGGGANNNDNNGKPKPAPEIPKLALKNKNTVIPPIQRPGVTILDPQTNRVEDPLMSQTARLPAATKTTVNNDSLNLSLQPLSIKNGGGVQLNPIMPQSARAVLESIPKNYNQTVSNSSKTGGENSPQKQNPSHQKNLSLDDHQENPPLIEAVRPPPEFLAEGYDMEGRGRPNTRRSRMRSRGGENPPEEEPQHFEPLPAEGLLEMDEIPVPLDHTILHVKATPPQNITTTTNQKQPIAAVRAPDGFKPTAATAAVAAAGGRRGKNLVQSTPVQGSEINETKPLVVVQPVPPVALKPSAPAGPSQPQQQQQSVPLKPVRPAPPTQVAPQQQAVHLPAGVPPDSTAFNNNRHEANKNKMAAQGTLRFN